MRELSCDELASVSGGYWDAELQEEVEVVTVTARRNPPPPPYTPNPWSPPPPVSPPTGYGRPTDGFDRPIVIYHPDDLNRDGVVDAIDAAMALAAANSRLEQERANLLENLVRRLTGQPRREPYPLFPPQP
jgi:hypothetical protein